MVIIRKSQIVNRKLSSLQGISAFTLIELIVAISLASILILATAMIFKQASSAFTESDARNEVYQNVRAAFDIIKRDVSGATLNTNHEWFKGDLNNMIFLSSTPNNINQPIALIEYSLSGNTLNKSEITNATFHNISSFGTATATGILGLNVKTLQFRFRKGINWYNSWDSTGTNTAQQYILPDAVEVKMAVSDTLNRYTGTSTNIISIMR